MQIFYSCARYKIMWMKLAFRYAGTEAFLYHEDDLQVWPKLKAYINPKCICLNPTEIFIRWFAPLETDTGCQSKAKF